MLKGKNTERQPVSAAEFDTKAWRVYEIVFAPDSRTLVVVGHESFGLAVLENDVWSMRILPPLEAQPLRVVFSPDSKWFVIPPFEKPVQCWSTAPKLLWETKPGGRDADVSPDGKTVAVTRRNLVLLCDAETGKPRCEMAGHTKTVEELAFSPGGERLASFGQSQVCLWDVASGKLLAVPKSPPGEVNSMAFSPDGRSLVVGDAKGVVHVFDALSGQKQHEWEAHGCNVYHLAFTSDSKRLLTQSFGEDLTLRIWDFPSCRQLREFPTASTGFHLSPGNKKLFLLVGPEGKLQVKDLATGQPCNDIWKSPPHMSSLKFSPDGNWLAGNMDNGTVQVWRITSALSQ